MNHKNGEFPTTDFINNFHYPIRNGISHRDLEQIANSVGLELVHGLYGEWALMVGFIQKPRLLHTNFYPFPFF